MSCVTFCHPPYSFAYETVGESTFVGLRYDAALTLPITSLIECISQLQQHGWCYVLGFAGETPRFVVTDGNIVRTFFAESAEEIHLICNNINLCVSRDESGRLIVVSVNDEQKWNILCGVFTKVNEFNEVNFGPAAVPDESAQVPMVEPLVHYVDPQVNVAEPQVNVVEPVPMNVDTPSFFRNEGSTSFVKVGNVELIRPEDYRPSSEKDLAALQERVKALANVKFRPVPTKKSTSTRKEIS